jgi:very-short-patch-repair endonuclease
MEDMDLCKIPHPPAPSPTSGEGEKDNPEFFASLSPSQLPVVPPLVGEWAGGEFLQRNILNTPDDLSSKVLEAARDFRKNPTRSEALLWQALRGKRLSGIKFRRQQPIGPFVVDFYAPALRLVIEIDGAIHQQQREVDQIRQYILESLDLKVLRFSAEQVENDIASVLSSICNEDARMTPHPPTPSPTSREGEEENLEFVPSLSPSPLVGEGAGGEVLPPQDAL